MVAKLLPTFLVFILLLAAPTTWALAQIVGSQHPNPTVTSYTLGLTVADIYDRGVIVTNVDLGSRAREIGIQKSDVILGINGEPVRSADEFQFLLHAFAGNPMTFQVSRVGELMFITVTH
jgi:S1-C subfamily serine protease